MARPRVDAALAALARRRADFSSAHFGLAYAAPGALDPQEFTGAAVPAGQRIAIAVPKRLLRRAVDRNAMKRVAREAWRLADWGASATPPPRAMLKLRRAEAAWKTMGRSAVKKAWRAEIDALLVQLLRRLALPSGSAQT
jgi:RNase P protein component